ncbi:MAG TPA: hypothetical protein PKL91_08175 [Bacteroidales bacterium]|jgi:hypothetical protein|nr:hypothetical protein [Bacteroidales bacterium]
MEEKINALKEFLKQCNALEAFMNGVCRRHPQLRFSEDPIRDFCLGQSYVPDWTTMCFFWTDLTPGRAFWKQRHDEWREICAINNY